MKIRSVHVRYFRSIANSALLGCGNFNVLVGKNNAGKSNLLSTIDLMLGHLKKGKVAGPWPMSGRAIDEFTDRDKTNAVQIGLEFDLPAHINGGLRERLRKEAPHLERSVEQIKSQSTVAFILSGVWDEPAPYVYLEQAAVGGVQATDTQLKVTGINLLSVSKSVARELYLIQQEASDLAAEADALRRVKADREAMAYLQAGQKEDERYRFYFLDRALGPLGTRSSLLGKLTSIMRSASTPESLESGLSQLEAEARQSLAKVEQRQTEGVMPTFAGETRIQPGYAGWLMEQFGSLRLIHLRETKRPIGREEAEALLRMKVRRGGPERLRGVQQTIHALLGVNVDAFQPEEAVGQERGAEMDIDEFLVEANGAGIREALRLILDLELRNPQLVLIEEPEVHLHPALERAVEGYLRERSHEMQMFITTHSTNFVDSSTFQNVYLLSRDNDKKTVCRAVTADEAAISIPAELGLRLSSVFMFDRLVFVEGASDEAVLRKFATTLEMDLARANVGFVHMRGVRNFAHFAAGATLELLTRRRLRMWFVADRDERGDREVDEMIRRLGERARLTVFQRRELENYLLDPGALTAFLIEKRKAAGVVGAHPEQGQVKAAITEEAEALKDEVIRLRFERQMLHPVFLHTRASRDGVNERIESALKELSGRLRTSDETRNKIVQEVESQWHDKALDLSPGCTVLDRVATRFGVGFSKEKGDSERLASLIPQNGIASEIQGLLAEVCGLGGE